MDQAIIATLKGKYKSKVLLPPNWTSVHQPMDQAIIATLKGEYKSKVLLPPNWTSVHQPMDQAIIATLKGKYKSKVLLPQNWTSVHQPMDQAIIATLKGKYKSKVLHAMIKNLERYDESRAVGESILAEVRGLNNAYPPNLLDAATIAHEVWKSVGQTTLVNCWLKVDTLPACHVESFETYRRPLELPAVEELSSLLQHVTINSQLSIQDENDHPLPTIGREQLIGEFVALQQLKMIMLDLLVY